MIKDKRSVRDMGMFLLCVTFSVTALSNSSSDKGTNQEASVSESQVFKYTVLKSDTLLEIALKYEIIV